MLGRIHLRTRTPVGSAASTSYLSGGCVCPQALTRGSGDNITVAVAFLQPVSTLEVRAEAPDDAIP